MADNNDGCPPGAMRFFTPSSFWSPEWMPPISAWLEHGPFAFWVTEVQRPACLVELGSHWGYSYMAFCQSVKSHKLGTRCYAVDTWRGDGHAGAYGEDVYTKLQEYNQRNYSTFSSLIRSTFDQALEHFSDGSVDLLHIDGFHTYEAVKHDFETWLPKLSRRGLILFHDTNVREHNFGVWRLWKELCGKYPHFEFLHGHGLGVLGVGSEQPVKLQDFFAIQAGSVEAVDIQNGYSRLGCAVTCRQLATVVESASNWQRHWFKRAFHRWRPSAVIN